MPMTPLVTAGLESVLNTFLWRDRGLKSARQRLMGKVLRVELKEFSAPLVLVFSEQQIDVLGAWEGEADCCVITRLAVLPKLRDRQQLTALIRSGDLEVQGDLQVVQNWVALMDLAEFDPAELFAPYIGDVAAEGISKVMRGGGQFLKKDLTAISNILLKPLLKSGAWHQVHWKWHGLLKKRQPLNARSRH